MNENINLEEQPLDEMMNMYLNFSIANEIYSIEIRHVLQIVGMQEISEMPEMSYHLKGYINIRNNVIPVVSLRLRFGKPDADYTDRMCIIVVQVEDREIGLIVDTIEETLTIMPDDIAPQPTTGESETNPYIIGIAKLKNKQTSIVVNLQKLFSGHKF